MRIRTVVIERNGAPLVINEADFRQGSDTLWSEVCDESKETEPEVEPEVENDIRIKHKGGGRWIVMVNGVQANDGTLSKFDAQALAAEY